MDGMQPLNHSRRQAFPDRFKLILVNQDRRLGWNPSRHQERINLIRESYKRFVWVPWQSGHAMILRPKFRRMPLECFGGSDWTNGEPGDYQRAFGLCQGFFRATSSRSSVPQPGPVGIFI